ncbi:hypothetical protein SAMN06272789_0172 [Streptomyces sp. 1331.2]|nr:hypothetical protein SAMN06272789_0172 [Streptomyces sp. 1331.2]
MHARAKTAGAEIIAELHETGYGRHGFADRAQRATRRLSGPSPAGQGDRHPRSEPGSSCRQRV